MPSGSRRLPVRRPAETTAASPERGSASSTGTSMAMISDTSARANFAPSPPPSPWLCHAPKRSAVGESSKTAVASAALAAAMRLPSALCMNGSSPRRLSRRIAS